MGQTINQIPGQTLFQVLAIALLLLVAGGNLIAQDQFSYQHNPIDRSGTWRFYADYSDSGLRVQLQNQALPLATSMRLPGILQNSFGIPITTTTPWVLSLYDRYWYLREDYKAYTDKQVKVPFLSQPQRHYLGAAWYQRDIDIPNNWANRRVVLTLERPHWQTTVWVDT